MESVFKSTNLRGKTALDLAGDAGAIRLLMFLSPIVPASINRTPPPVRTPGEGAKEKSASVTAPTLVKTEPSFEAADETDAKMPETVSIIGERRLWTGRRGVRPSKMKTVVDEQRCRYVDTSL